jgi:endonuclease YncB( thermonuclease family)
MADWQWPNSKIVRVIDGDTVVAQLTRDLGFNGTATFKQRLRLNRINCPSIHTDEGAKAAMFVTDKTANDVLAITTVGPYKYGDEWMAEIESPSCGNLSNALVEAGHAVYWDGKGPRPGG